MAIITMSREVGSGGNELARRVCRTLSYRYFERNLMNELSLELGLADKGIIPPDDRVHSSDVYTKYLDPEMGMRRKGAWDNDDAGHWAEVQRKFGEKRSAEIQTEIIKAAAVKDNILIVGRGGQAILQGVPGVFHVRVIAPIAHRIAYVAETGGMSKEDAHEKVLSRDKAAADYVHKYYGINNADPLHYHIVINLGLVSIEDAEKMIVASIPS